MDIDSFFSCADWGRVGATALRLLRVGGRLSSWAVLHPRAGIGLVPGLQSTWLTLGPQWKQHVFSLGILFWGQLALSRSLKFIKLSPCLLASAHPFPGPSWWHHLLTDTRVSLYLGVDARLGLEGGLLRHVSPGPT